jgi:hypothetical protein
MPQRNSSRRILVRLILFTFAGWLLWGLGKKTEAEQATTAIETSEPAPTREKGGGFSRRRLATTLAFTTLFFAGAAFSGVAGELFVNPARGAEGCATETTSEDTEPAPDATEPEASPAPEQSCDASSSEETPVEGTSSEESPEAAPATATTEEGETGNTGTDTNADESNGSEAENQSGGDQGDQSGDQGSGSGDSNGSVPDPILGDGSGDGSGGSDQSDEPDAGPGSPAHAGDDQGSESDSVGLTSGATAAKDLEFDGADYGVVWLHRTLPDPTPPAARLDARFASLLSRTAKANHVDWALVLGVVRADGHKTSWPASARQLRFLSTRLHSLRANTDEWRAVLALSGRTAFADRAVALANYDRAVGLRGLVRGLVAETPVLERRVLNDPRLSVYAGGRDDIVHHRINVRVLVLMRYMAETYDTVTVSSLDTGHGLYARPGVVSAHKYGLAVDIAALGGTSILGHQQTGSITEKAVRSILLLPVELRPKQVISLIGLGGPSFPLANHYDHIHVGY